MDSRREYGICKQYHMYIGETGRRLADRIIDIFYCQFFNGFPVVHFKPPLHCLFNDLSVTGIICCSGSNENQLKI